MLRRSLICLAGLWRFCAGEGQALLGMKLALSALEADEVHRSCGHGGSVDADREVRVPSEGLSLNTPQGRSPGESLPHQIRSDRYDDTGGHREALGLQETRGHLQSRSRAPF